jgi:excinuclease ABC subunit A
LNRLVDLGNTVIIIEHHLDIIKQADWIIDLGPEGGEGGGRIVAQGTPEQVAHNKKSYTGQVLARALNGISGNGSGAGDAKDSKPKASRMASAGRDA